MRAFDPIESARIEKAVLFMSRAWEQGARNSKPTLFHSLRVAFALLDFGYPVTCAELAILHDILEDTAVTHVELVHQFGQEIADLVLALSHQEDIQNWEERYLNMFRRTIGAGKIATVVKMVDLADNSLYIDRVKDRVFRADLVKKMRVYLDLTEKYAAEPAWRYLHSRWEEAASF